MLLLSSLCHRQRDGLNYLIDIKDIPDDYDGPYSSHNFTMTYEREYYRCYPPEEVNVLPVVEPMKHFKNWLNMMHGQCCRWDVTPRTYYEYCHNESLTQQTPSGTMTVGYNRGEEFNLNENGFETTWKSKDGSTKSHLRYECDITLPDEGFVTNVAKREDDFWLTFSSSSLCFVYPKELNPGMIFCRKQSISIQ